MFIEQKQDKVFKPTSVFTRSAEEDNQVTTELQNLIFAGGITPSASDLTQVKTAVQNLISAGGGLPSQTGQSGKFLTTNGTVASWAEVSGGGADTALSNLTNTGKEVVANLSSPSPDYVDLTVPSTDGDTVTAPDDGYFVIKAKINSISDCAVNLRNTTNGQYNQCWSSFRAYAVEVATSIPVSKNDVVAVGFFNVVFNNASQPGYLRFIYANGTKHNKPAN